MDTGMIAVRTFDYAVASAVTSDPVIFDAISEDGVNEFIPDVLNEFWVAMYLESGELIGVYRLHSLNSRTLQIHAHILPDYRKEYAKESSSVILAWCLNNVDFDKIVAVIPQIYKNVYHFTKNAGFKDEGFNRMSFKKRGKLVGQYYLGITRDEIIEVLNNG